MSVVVGIDLSSRAVDLVRLDEDKDEATWQRVELEGASAWERVRTIQTRMPGGSWWDDVYLCAVERPFAKSRNDVVRLAEGAILASIPASVHCWEVTPQTWKAARGFNTRKPAWTDFPAGFWRQNWPQDALDALGVALYARDLNAAGIKKAIGA